MKVLTSRTFLRRVRDLLHLYPHIFADIAPIIAELKAGATPGDRVPRVSGRAIYKVRAPNSDAQSGKSGGYRILYYLVDKEQRLLITIYSKSDQTDISAAELVRIVTEWETEHS